MLCQGQKTTPTTLPGLSTTIRIANNKKGSKPISPFAKVLMKNCIVFLQCNISGSECVCVYFKCDRIFQVKRVFVYLARRQSRLLVDEVLTELQSVETLPFTVERTTSAPYFRYDG